jgi:peptidoglycan/xylan/chitin deacetylase (PgdA/CDA1 family)
MPLNLSLKACLKSGLLNSGALALAQRLRGKRAIILRYHSVQHRPHDYAHIIGTPITHATAAFQEQIDLVTRHYEPVTLDDIAAFARGQSPLPRRCVAVTFDDGFADNFEIATPILNRAGIKATFYITVGCIEPERLPWFSRLRHVFGTSRAETWWDPARQCLWRLTDPQQRRQAHRSAAEVCARTTGAAQDELVARLETELGVTSLALGRRLMMTWEQIRELHRQGHLIGAHTLTHPNLAYVPADEMARELAESKRRLEAALKAPVQHFSYPAPILEPHFSEQSVACTADLGFVTAVTCRRGGVRVGDALLRLRRIPAPLETPAFKWALAAAFVGWHPEAR